MMIVFGILCFIGGLNAGVLMSIWVSNITEKRYKEREVEE